MTPLYQSFMVLSDDHVGEVRRGGARAARNAGLSENQISNTAIITTELATNLVKHTSGGKILIASSPGLVQVFALDQGPGLQERALKDGFSSKGTQGSGLGAVKRLASTFDFYSSKEHGSVIFAEVRFASSSERQLEQWFALRVPAHGEIECGDCCSVEANHRQLSVALLDGLGHGPEAAKAAHLAAELHAQTPSEAPNVVLNAIHRNLRSTRGAVGLALVADTSKSVLCYSGIGNIVGQVVGLTQSRSLTSHNGTLGFQVSRIQEYTLDWQEESLLILHSDGLTSRWSVHTYPGLFYRHPALIAAVLVRDYLRGRDDASIFVARLPRRIA